MKAVLNNKGLHWLLAAGAAFVTLLSLLLYNSTVHWTQAGSISSLCLWLGLGLLYRAALARLHRRLFWVCLAGAVLFATFQTTGDKFITRFDSGLIPLKFLGAFFLFFACLCLLFAWVDGWQRAPARPLGRAAKKLEKWLAAGPKAFWAVAGVLFLCWLPYLIIHWPGLVSEDTKTQMAQWASGSITAHHPIVHTAFLGLFLQLGTALLGSAAAGLGLGTALQMALLAMVLAAGLCTMARLGVGLWWRVGIGLFYALCPLFGWYATTLWKDIWLAAFALLFYLCLVALCRSGAAFFARKQNVALLGAAALGLILSKNNGIHLFLLAGLAVLLFQRQALFIRGMVWKTAAMLVAGLAVWLLWEGPVYGLLGVQKGDMREALSIPLLQIARVARDAPEGISPEDETLLRAVLPYDELAERYDPHVADGVKDTFNSEEFRKAPGAYIGLWARLGLEYPGLYLHSFLEQTYGYWYPDVRYWVFAAERYSGTEKDPQTGEWILGEAAEPNAAQQALNSGMQGLRAVPGFSMLQSVAFYFWLLLAAALYAVYRKKKGVLPPLALFLGVWLVCLASPVYAEFRYAFPAILAAPVVLGLVFGNRDTQAEGAYC